MKIGVSLKIDVTKLDKARFFKGKKGTYADLTVFVDTENTSEYGDNGTISQSTSQEERQAGTKMPIIGNARIFYTDGNNQGTTKSPSMDKNQNSGYKKNQGDANNSDYITF